MRTEADLRAALAMLERHAPSAASVLPGARRRPLARRPVLAVAVAVAVSAAVVVAMTVTGTPARTAGGGTQSAALRTAILTALSSASDEILHVHLSSPDFGAAGGRDVWYSPWLAQPFQQVRVRTLLRAADGRPEEAVGESYTMPGGGVPLTPVPSLSGGWSPYFAVTAAATTFVDYADRSWWSTTDHELMVQIPDDPALIRDEIVQGHWVIIGHPTVNGQATIELRWSSPASFPAKLRSALVTWLWVDAKTYLPVREKGTVVTRIQKNDVFSTAPTFSTFQFLSPTASNLAQLRVAIPKGFRHAS
jgi:hypothetical protein